MYAVSNNKAFQSKAKRLLSQVNNVEQAYCDDMEPPPHPCEETDTTEHITFPQRTVITRYILQRAVTKLIDWQTHGG